MKHIITILLFSIGILTAQAQSTFINYQGVARDGSGTIMTNTTIAIQIVLKFGTTTSTARYVETHSVTTDTNGVFSLQIGNGTAIIGVYNDLVWGEENAFATISIDGAEVGTTELHAVPYALHAANAISKINDLTDARSDSDGSSLFLGLNAGANDDGSTNRNTGIGFEALFSNTTGFGNTANGHRALYSNTTGGFNTANGYHALYSNTIGERNTANGHRALRNNTTGSRNTANGFESLYSNTIGERNTANGYHALILNTTGSYNTANGYQALILNTTGDSNTANGYEALARNTSGNANTANGHWALRNNTTGSQNTANGYQALHTTTTGIRNTATGTEALFYNNTGNYNTANGYKALYNSKGNNNTALGRQALFDLTTGSNNIGIGYDAQIPNNSGDNQIRMGNTSITYAGIQVAWTVTSDKYWKKNIRSLPYGLDLVMQLEPVDYIRKNNTAKTREMGFVAQDIESVLAKVGYTEQGFLTKDDNDRISLRYNDLIALLTKAVQEQQTRIEKLATKIKILENENK